MFYRWEIRENMGSYPSIQGRRIQSTGNIYFGCLSGQYVFQKTKLNVYLYMWLIIVLLLQIDEDKAIGYGEEWLSRRGYNVDVLVFDGIMVRKDKEG